MVRVWFGCGSGVVRMWLGVVRVWFGHGSGVARVWFGCGSGMVRVWLGYGLGRACLHLCFVFAQLSQFIEFDLNLHVIFEQHVPQGVVTRWFYFVASGG